MAGCHVVVQDGRPHGRLAGNQCPAARIVDRQVAPGMAGRVHSFHDPVGTQAKALAAVQRQIDRIAETIPANGGFALLAVANAMISLKLGIASPNQGFSVLYPRSIQVMAGQQRLGCCGLHRLIAALMIEV